MLLSQWLPSGHCSKWFQSYECLTKLCRIMSFLTQYLTLVENAFKKKKVKVDTNISQYANCFLVYKLFFIDYWLRSYAPIKSKRQHAPPPGQTSVIDLLSLPAVCQRLETKGFRNSQHMRRVHRSLLLTILLLSLHYIVISWNMPLFKEICSGWKFRRTCFQRYKSDSVYIRLFHECMAWQNAACREWSRRLIFMHLKILFLLAIVFVYIYYSLDECFFISNAVKQPPQVDY